MDRFPFFQNPVDWAHLVFLPFARRGDFVIDATVGNGNDALLLAKLVLTEREGTLFCFDIQERAIEKSREHLKKELSDAQFQRIRFFSLGHETFPKEIEEESVSLVVYNLGYLPGGEKSIVSKVETTLQSVERALKLIKRGGALSITCYPGHEEGKKEEEALIAFTSTLNQRDFQVTFTRWLNRKASPSHLLIQRRG